MEEALQKLQIIDKYYHKICIPTHCQSLASTYILLLTGNNCGFKLPITNPHFKYQPFHLHSNF